MTPSPAAFSSPALARLSPWVELKYYTYHPHVYPRFLGAASPDARPGSWVRVYGKNGEVFGAGLFNPRANVPLRLTRLGPDPAQTGEAELDELLDRAIDLRQRVLRLPEVTLAYRVVHSDGDQLGGLVVDRFGDVLSVEVHSLGVWQRLRRWLPRLHAALGTSRHRVSVDPAIARMEGIKPASGDVPETAPVRPVKLTEHGVRYEVDFDEGHKTGFFCDQRDNRRRLGELAKGAASALDLCCYTGGFALSARLLAGVEEVTGVDLDEAAIAQAKRNANLNQTRVNWVHADAFAWARQMQKNGDRWPVVVLDPPKLMTSPTDTEGKRKYDDLNALATSLCAPGALFVSCSCSGALSEPDFEQLVIRAVHRCDRRLQILDRTGPGADHPVFSNCPESRYLKVLWGRVW